LARLFGISILPDVRRYNSTPDSLSEAERSDTDLHRLFYDGAGPHRQKWHHYLAIYDRYLSRFRGKAFRMLEIGVLDGGSLHLWRRYFGPDATLFGIDIDQGCAQFDGKDGKVRIGSQADAAFLKSVIAEMGGVDVVIDDGSHIAAHQRASFDALFPLLSDGGIYICEDLHTSYWPGFYQGGYRRRGTFIEIAKSVIDDMHADFHSRGKALACADRSIGGVHFHNSIVVIEKTAQSRPVHLNVGGEAQT
jgi:hypothetical protein